MSEMDIPANSHKSQQAPKGSEQGDPKKPQISVFNGDSAGVKRKANKSVWKWFKRMFLSDRSPKEVAEEVFKQTIVPSIQDNFRNSALAMLDGIIYKNAAPRSSGTGNSVSYNKIYTGQPQRSSNQTSAQTAKQEQADEINKGFNNPSFRTKNDANIFLQMMKEYDYPTLSVHTMYMMRNKHIDYTWDAYGWTREEIAALGPNCIVTIGNSNYPYMIDLPEAHIIA